METQPLIRIALADDHPLTIEGSKFVINSFGNCRVDIEAYDGESFLQKLKACDVLPDICIVDIRMPALDGFGVLEEIKRCWPEIKVIMQSFFDNEHNIIRAFRMEAAAFLSKSASISDMRKAIDEVYQYGYYYSPWMKRNIIPRLFDKNNLTEHDRLLLRYCCEHITHKEIARRMNKSLGSVNNYYAQLYKKLDVDSNIALAIFAVETGVYVRPKAYT